MYSYVAGVLYVKMLMSIFCCGLCTEVLPGFSINQENGIRGREEVDIKSDGISIKIQEWGDMDG